MQFILPVKRKQLHWNLSGWMAGRMVGGWMDGWMDG